MQQLNTCNLVPSEKTGSSECGGKASLEDHEEEEDTSTKSAARCLRHRTLR